MRALLTLSARRNDERRDGPIDQDNTLPKPAHRVRHLPVLGMALLTLAASGCGVSDPYQDTSPHRASTARTAATSKTTSTATRKPPADKGDPAPERDGTIPRRAQAAQNQLDAGAGRSSPQAALARYAAIYLNWDAARVIAIQRRLAAISLGQARAQAQQAAVSASRDHKLIASKVTNRGRVIAISPGQSTAAGKWVIVTSEQTSGPDDYQDLPATLHVTYAAVTHTNEGWVVSQWAPQN